jgi:hypothetical protein
MAVLNGSRGTRHNCGLSLRRSVHLTTRSRAPVDRNKRERLRNLPEQPQMEARGFSRETVARSLTPHSAENPSAGNQLKDRLHQRLRGCKQTERLRAKEDAAIPNSAFRQNGSSLRSGGTLLLPAFSTQLRSVHFPSALARRISSNSSTIPRSFSGFRWRLITPSDSLHSFLMRASARRSRRSCAAFVAGNRID